MFTSILKMFGFFKPEVVPVRVETVVPVPVVEVEEPVRERTFGWSPRSRLLSTRHPCEEKAGTAACRRGVVEPVNCEVVQSNVKKHVDPQP